MDPAVFKFIADYGVAIVALVAVSSFTFYFLRRYIDDLTRQRDIAIAGWQGQIAATDKLADSVRVLTEIVKDRRR